MTPDSPTPAKLCPRCGAFYQDLKSQTCPQCFARLVVLDEEDTRRLSAEQEARVADPAFAAAKGQEDEHFREQSFGACLAVLAVALATLVASVVFLVIAAHHAKPRIAPAAAPAVISVDTLLPAQLGGFARKTQRQAGHLPGTSIPLYLGVYQSQVQVYAAPAASLSTEEQQALALAGSLAAQQHNPPLSEQEITTASAHYVVLGESAASVGRVAHSLAIMSTPK